MSCHEKLKRVRAMHDPTVGQARNGVAYLSARFAFAMASRNVVQGKWDILRLKTRAYQKIPDSRMRDVHHLNFRDSFPQRSRTRGKGGRGRQSQPGWEDNPIPVFTSVSQALGSHQLEVLPLPRRTSQLETAVGGGRGGVSSLQTEVEQNPSGRVVQPSLPGRPILRRNERHRKEKRQPK